ncbi:WG repeat-containing protein [Dyadobacter chenhuakuii]|uniref:WG repeat-containing protein n=1 Tax=Dyadobacter chenhuakuii TaxID=2909339 RepID=A0ABY4XM55_9BACT|nr:WG repeat-containing protein [Dyadobacter chenhuakuii]MCF2495155.1 WG repeat-containing protein [Dyadobacter chenhuakuii]USJ31534.1 WG repeat-containing protein [Dyadobacter chenhuakuii]
MFQKAVSWLLIICFAAFFQGAFGQSVPVPGKPWLSEYNVYKEYKGVYVVKKITIPCRAYETFLVDNNGKRLTPAYRDIGEFSGDLAEFVPMELDEEKLGRHGFINRRGEVVIQPVYVSTDKFYEGKTWVIYRAGKQYGLSYIDSTGKEIYKVPIQYFRKDFLISTAKVDMICNQDTREDILWWKGRNYFILNWNFSPFIEKEVKSSKYIYHFLYEGKYGIIDNKMILRVPVSLDDIDPEYKFSGQGMERVKYGDKFGYINVFTGELITDFLYTDTRKPTSGLFWVKKNNKWGCIDKTGKTRIPFLYEEATGFTSEDRSAVAINGKFGHIDKKGKIRTPLKYDFASYFNRGISMVRINDKYGYIDINDRYIIEPIYDEALPFDKETTVVERLWLRFELSMKGEEKFIGFSYKLNAIFILIGLVLFVYINSFIFKRVQQARLRKKK